MNSKCASIVAVLMVAGLAVPAMADGQGRWRNGPMPGPGMMGMMPGAPSDVGPGMMWPRRFDGPMMGPQDGMMWGRFGPGMMGDYRGMMPMMHMMHGNMMGAPHGRMMGGRWLWQLDADDDGDLTEAEIVDGLKAYDADGDGNLSIAEFEAAHTALIRETMVDRFQHLDADGDGAVTPDELGQMTRERQWFHRWTPPMLEEDDDSKADE